MLLKSFQSDLSLEPYRDWVSMKACFFTNEFPPNVYGGAGVHVDYLSRELSKLCQLQVKCFGRQDSQSKKLSVKGVEVSEGLLKGIPKDLSFVFSAFYKNLMFFNPPFDTEIVHCHTWYSHLAGIIAKLAYGVPLVVTTHSLEPLRPWKREQIGKGYDVSSWVESEALRLADAIVAVSEDTKKDILAHFPVSPKKIHVIPNGIDTGEYKPVKGTKALERFGIRKDKPYVLFVGRITRQKGIIHLVDAVPFLDKEIQVVLCAGAPDTPEIKKEMEEHVAEVKKKRDNLIWISEMVDVPTKVELYSHASVFCCPSIYEPFGIINLEAMACSIPVVATRIGGIPEIVVDGETGILVPLSKDPSGNPKNPIKFSKDLAAGINKIVRDPNLSKAMGIKSRKRAAQVFSWSSIAKRIFDLYKKLLTSKKGNKK